MQPGNAQYTCWLDDRGFVIEDGVILHTAKDEFLLTSAEPNFAYFRTASAAFDVTIEEVSHDIGALAFQGRSHGTSSRGWCPRWSTSPTSASPRARSAGPA